MNDCNCNPKPCEGLCGRPHGGCDPECACPIPYLGIEQLPDHPTVLRYNIDGKRVDYDYANLIYTAQSDTVLVADAINRLLTYQAERHTDTITAKELGAVLHLADLGDVDVKQLNTGSMLTYQKGGNCAEGCIGIYDSWKVWNSLDEQVSSATYPMAFNASGAPVTIQRPQNPSRQYLLGWNGSNQVSYITPTKAANAPSQGGPLYYDESTGQIVYVKGN